MADLDDWEKEALEEEEEDKWAGEDADDDDALDAWDAEPEEPKTEAKKKQVAKPKKLSKKQLEKKQADMERDARRKLGAMNEEEREAERARQLAAIQKSNELLIDDVFGGEQDFGGDEEETPAVDGFDRDAVKAKANEDLFGVDDDEDEEEEKKEEEDNLKDFPVTTEKEMEELSSFIAKKLKKAPGTKLVIHFLKDMLKKGTEDMKMDDVKLVQKELTNIYNIKRVEHNQKKQKKKKPTLKMKSKGRGDDFDLDGGDDDFGDDFF